jgi:hypothetical protein
MNFRLVSNRRNPFLWGFSAILCARVLAFGHDPVLRDSWITDGQVLSVALSNGVTYIGGNFGIVGPATGPGAPLDASTHHVITPFAKISDGGVSASLADDNGGWYIAGTFTNVAGAMRAGLAHVLSDGTVDPTWTPSLPAGAAITCMVKSGATIFIGGTFASVSGQPRANLAAIDATNGSVASFNPAPDNSVETLQLNDAGDRLYVGGQFLHIGGQSRRYLAALDTNTGLPTSWNPDPSDIVHALALSPANETVYIGGLFHSVGAAARNYIASISSDTGVAQAGWNPNADAAVSGLAQHSGIVYAGGPFHKIAGITRNGAAAIDGVTGNLTSWNPNADGAVDHFVFRGTDIFVSGPFHSIGGRARDFAAKVDATFGAADPLWDANADGAVDTLCLSSDQNQIYIGGAFDTVGGEKRQNLAALDVAGQVTPWNPGADGGVAALAIVGNTLYIGGDFTSVAAQARHHIAALDARNGVPTGWNPNADAAVLALAVQGDTVYAGGQFSHIGAQGRSFLAAISATTGLATAWNPSVNDRIFSVVPNGAVVYAAGHFTQVGAQARNFVAAIDSTTALATAWDAQANDTVNDVAIVDNIVYLGGNFSQAGGQPRAGMAAVGSETGLATAWNPNAAGAQVRALSAGGNTLYAGGSISSVGGAARGNVVAIDTTSAQPAAWNPQPDGLVYDLQSSGASLAVAGNFKTIEGQLHQGIALYSIDAITNPPPQLLSLTPTSGPSAGGTLMTITGAHFLAGAAVTVDGSPATSVTVVSPTQITAVTTGGSVGAKDVRVINPDAQSAVIVGGFTYTIAELPPTLTGIFPSSGPFTGGTAVTLSGANFKNGALVTIDGNSASSVVVVSSVQITAVTPPGFVGARTVRVINPDHQSMSLIGAFTYIGPVSSPTVTGIAPSSGPVTGGTEIVIAGLNFQNGATVSIGGASALNVMVESATRMRAITPPGLLGPRDVVVTNPDNRHVTVSAAYVYVSSVPEDDNPAPSAPTPTVVRVYPNPFRASQHHQMIFDVAAGSTVKIFAVTGEQVRALQGDGLGHASWDVRNDDGAPVASGSYLYLVISPDGRKTTGQLVVIR